MVDATVYSIAWLADDWLPTSFAYVLRRSIPSGSIYDTGPRTYVLGGSWIHCLYIFQWMILEWLVQTARIFLEMSGKNCPWLSGLHCTTKVFQNDLSRQVGFAPGRVINKRISNDISSRFNSLKKCGCDHLSFFPFFLTWQTGSVS